MLGASRVALGQSLYMEADNYFHSGVKHTRKTAFTDFFQRWDAVMAPELHKHTMGGSIYEVMPWLRFATERDPQNVEAYLTASYWLAGEGARPDLAEQIMMEAQRNNPEDYRVLQEKGRLFMKEKKDEQAANALDYGIRLWPSPLDPADKQARLDMGQMLTFRASLYEKGGERAKALTLLRQALEVVPDNRALAARIQELENSQISRSWTASEWREVFPQKSTCSREERPHSEQEEDGGHDHENGGE